MLNSFVSALSALRANGTGVDAVGNNLANLSTVGFKKSTVNFRDVVGDVLSGSGATQVGSGVAQPFTPKQFTQGSIQTTGGDLDAAIQGDGFFILRKTAGTGTSSVSAGTVYSRAGDFKVDQSGRLVSQSGELVQGWSLNTAQNAINTADAIGDIVVPVGSSRPARATTNMNIDLNLDGSAASGTVYSVPVPIYDSLGNPYTLTVNYTKTANTGEWDVSYSLPATDGTVTAPASTITFDTNGNLQTVPDGPPPGSFGGIDIQFTNPAVNSITNLTYSLWNSVPNDPDPGSARITQFSQSSAASLVQPDGAAAALLSGVSLYGGSVMASYSNGDQVEVARLALASIRNPESLVATGNNNYTVGCDTSTPTVGEANTGGRGAIVSQSLESSNVDIAEEFTKLIVFQRGYQANARVITTSDEISQETINLKR